MGLGWIATLKEKAQGQPAPTGAPLTDAQALALAQQRWGSRGAAFTTTRDGGGLWYHVGYEEQYPTRRVVTLGVGGKWESAFRDADLREAQQAAAKGWRKGGGQDGQQRPQGRRRRRGAP